MLAITAKKVFMIPRQSKLFHHNGLFPRFDREDNWLMRLLILCIYF